MHQPVNTTTEHYLLAAIPRESASGETCRVVALRQSLGAISYHWSIVQYTLDIKQVLHAPLRQENDISWDRGDVIFPAASLSIPYYCPR